MMKPSASKNNHQKILFAAFLVLSLVASLWLTGKASAQPAAGAGGQIRLQAQETATLTPAAPQPTPADSAGQNPNWFGFIMLLLCGMVGLLVLGIGMAILMVRLRQRLHP